MLGQIISYLLLGVLTPSSDPASAGHCQKQDTGLDGPRL